MAAGFVQRTQRRGVVELGGCRDPQAPGRGGIMMCLLKNEGHFILMFFSLIYLFILFLYIFLFIYF